MEFSSSTISLAKLINLLRFIKCHWSFFAQRMVSIYPLTYFLCGLMCVPYPQQTALSSTPFGPKRKKKPLIFAYFATNNFSFDNNRNFLCFIATFIISMICVWKTKDGIHLIERKIQFLSSAGACVNNKVGLKIDRQINTIK